MNTKAESFLLPPLLCCGVSTRAVGRKYECLKCERVYRKDGSRILDKQVRHKAKRRSRFMSYAELAIKSDSVLVEYALKVIQDRFSSLSNHAATGKPTREILSVLAQRYQKIIGGNS